MSGTSELKAFENVIGLEVKVTNTFDTIIVGTIYSYISSPGTLVLQLNSDSISRTSHNYIFLRTTHIKSLEVLSKKVDDTKVVKISPINPSTLSQVTKRNKELLSLHSQTRNENVSRDAQLLFNAIHKTIPEVKWEGNSIIVLDEVKIAPPYNPKAIKSLKKDTEESDEENYIINMVKRIMDSVWIKLESERKGG